MPNKKYVGRATILLEFKCTDQKKLITAMTDDLWANLPNCMALYKEIDRNDMDYCPGSIVTLFNASPGPLRSEL